MNRRRALGIAGGTLLGLTLVGGLGLHLLSRSLSGLPDAYAAMNVGFALAAHLRTPGNTWPASWDGIDAEVLGDLEADYPGFRERVLVRWEVPFEELLSARSADQPPYPLVRLVSGKPPGPTAWHDANQTIFRTLLDLREEHPGDGNAAPDSD